MELFNRLRMGIQRFQNIVLVPTSKTQINDQYSIVVGDTIKPTKEAKYQLTTLMKWKSAKVIQISKDGIVTYVTEDGFRGSTSLYWITNGNKKYGL